MVVLNRCLWFFLLLYDCVGCTIPDAYLNIPEVSKSVSEMFEAQKIGEKVTYSYPRITMFPAVIGEVEEVRPMK